MLKGIAYRLSMLLNPWGLYFIGLLLGSWVYFYRQCKYCQSVSLNFRTLWLMEIWVILLRKNMENFVWLVFFYFIFFIYSMHFWQLMFMVAGVLNKFTDISIDPRLKMLAFLKFLSLLNSMHRFYENSTQGCSFSWAFLSLHDAWQVIFSQHIGFRLIHRNWSPLPLWL